jgi:hypothetical protein
MSIKFTNQRFLSTANVAHMFYNVPLASQCFKVRVDVGGTDFVNGLVNVISRNIFDFIHSIPFSPSRAVTLNLQLNGMGGTVQVTIPLVVGSVYVICLVWDGNAGVQTCYVSGIPQIVGRLTGLTSNRIDPVQIGALGDSGVVYTLSDINAWDNYGLTQADAAALTNNVDPTTIGTGASWRCRWTLDGTTGAAATIGDDGLKNAYGLGADFASIAGTGTAVYAAPLVWAPTVTATPYVAGCGKVIAATLALNTDGSPVVATQLLTTPTITVNGINLGPLEKPWLTGIHQCVFYGTPGAVMIVQGDVVSLSAPTAWANTPAGPVAALAGTIDNRSGRSSVGADTMVKTLRMGMNHPSPGGLEYYPFKNAKFMVGFAGNFFKLSPGNGYQVVNQPGEAGRAYVVWDATVPLTPAQFTLSSGAPSLVTVTHNPEFDVSPSNGIGYVRGYDIAYVTNSAFETTIGGSIVALNYSDPGGASHYDDLWIYLPGETTLVNGVPVFDRSDPFALSNIYLDRVTQEMGSVRAVDITPNGSACLTFPFPELLLPRTVERFWGYAPIGLSNVGFTSIGPVDPTATPYIYSAQFRQPGQSYTATLTDTISTTPATGTHETWHFSDGATAPLMAALEVQIDNEIVRIISGSGTDWIVYRGSNGTTPATHASGPVTVYGRLTIRSEVAADGTAPFTAPALVQCNAPHGMTTGHGYYPAGVYPMVMADGTQEPNYSLGYAFITGPTSFMSILSGLYQTKPLGTKPSQTYTLDPASHYMQRLYFPGVPIDVYCEWVGKFPHANIHLNIPMDACDDLVYTFARTARDHFPAGRKLYIEYANEPWNFQPPFASNAYCSQIGPLFLPSSLFTYQLAYYAYRATQVHKIFRDVFTAAGRGGEIVGAVNCQMNSGVSQITPYLNTALAVGEPIDAIMGAPYYSMCSSGSALAQTVAAFELYDDDQACEMLLHDITYDTTGIVSWMKEMQGAIEAYNQANGKSCFLMGYEGGIEYAAPTGAANRNTRSVDLQYNPNFYNVEQGWYKILQDNGFDHLHVYGLGIGWPVSWGVYHLRTQHHSRGDGLNGAQGNRAICFNPANPNHHTDSYLQSDIHRDSVRGQAFVDWVDALSTTPATRYTLTTPTPDSGMVGVASGLFGVAPNGVYTGTITITPSGGGLSTPVVLTWTASSVPQTFSVTPTVAGTVTLTPANSGGLIDAGAVTYAAVLDTATLYTFDGPIPSSGEINVASGLFVVRPNGVYTGTITITLAMGGLTGPVVLTWAGSTEAQSFVITPTVTGIITLTPTSSPVLIDPAGLTYTATAPPPSGTAKFILVRKVIPAVP